MTFYFYILIIKLYVMIWFLWDKQSIKTQKFVNYRLRTKDDGRLCFLMCLSVQRWGGGGLPHGHWSLVPGPFGGWEYPLVSSHRSSLGEGTPLVFSVVLSKVLSQILSEGRGKKGYTQPDPPLPPSQDGVYPPLLNIRASAATPRVVSLLRSRRRTFLFQSVVWLSKY